MAKSEKIPSGYKKTEIGIIPEAWEVKRLGEIGEIITGGTPSTGNKKYWNGEYIWVTPTDISERKYIYNTERKLTKEGVDKVSFIPKNSLLVTCIASIGKNAILKKDGACNQQINAIIPFKNHNIDFLYYLIELNNDTLLKYAGQTATPILNKNDFSHLIFYFPPLSEQRAIARVLSDVDKFIESLGRLIEKKKLIKKGAMQELLTGKKRLPGFKGEWVRKKLGEIGEITGAGLDKKIRKNEIPIRLLNYMDVYTRDFLYNKEISFCTTAPKNKIEQCSIKKGDVFFTPSSELQTDIAISAVSMEDMREVVYSYHIVRFRLKENWDLKFRTYIFKTREFLRQAERFAEGSGKRYVISLKKFRELEIYYPQDIEEQRAIAKILSDMDAEIEALERKKKKYEMIKKGMMGVLLTGKVRIKNNNCREKRDGK